MEKRKMMTKRIACLLCSAVVFACALCSIPTQANAAIGGYRYPPQYFPVAIFDFCYAINGSGSRYYLGWPLNEFASPGYNYESRYEFTNDWFVMNGRTVMESSTDNVLFPYIAHSILTTNVNWADGTGRSFNLFAYETPWLNTWDDNVGYIVSFGNGGYDFDCDISFDLVYVTSTVGSNGNTYYQTVTVPNISSTYHAQMSDTIIGDFQRYNIDLAKVITEMYASATELHVPAGNDGVQMYELIPYIQNLNVKFYNVTEVPALSPSLPAWIYISAHTYRVSDSVEVPMPHAYNMGSWFDSLKLEHEDVTVDNSTIIYEMPTNWITWLGDAVGNVLNVQLFGNFSLGGLLATVIGVLTFMFFIKVFKG